MAKFLERLLEVALILGILYLVTGCHTIHGVGNDLMDWSSKYVERDK
jgi:predicted small secreted protein